MRAPWGWPIPFHSENTVARVLIAFVNGTIWGVLVGLPLGLLLRLLL
jgi:hypothetical protein